MEIVSQLRSMAIYNELETNPYSQDIAKPMHHLSSFALASVFVVHVGILLLRNARELKRPCQQVLAASVFPWATQPAPPGWEYILCFE